MVKIKWSTESMKKALIQMEPKVKERKQAAVLIPIISTNEKEIKLIFEKRPDRIRRHSGEVSFPGGLIEEKETPIEAALRETEEEIGIRKDKIKILGFLEPERTKSTGFLIIPVVGLITEDPELKINRGEIDEAFTVSIDELIKNRREMILGPYYKVRDQVIWGATARILEKLIEKLRDAGIISED